MSTIASAESADYTLVPRPDIDWASVPVLRSVKPNTNTVLDIVPNGNPKDHGTLGAAWIHVCNNDLAMVPVRLNCAVVASSDSAVRFGSSNYGTTPKRIEWLIGNKIVGYMDSNTLRLGSFDSKNAAEAIRLQSIEIDALKQEIKNIKTKMKALSSP